ncbi:hypothetical protein BGZ99_004295 [Dissophora globulifera]|uniref:Autophagy-related protein 29 n=1 Tax=Dissophora globulifera TaxID=979702 RepID=A0A9P6UUZ0_9FUNG|nr:hypothetical protein BGZ99_004295 [Dissophora globulifera]
MDPSEDSIHVIIRLPYTRPEGYVDTQPVQWTEAMEKTLWLIIGQTKPSLVDWNAVSRQLGNVPVPFLIQHATFLYHNQLQDLHRLGEQQDLTAHLRSSSQTTSRGVVGPGTVITSLEVNSPTPQPPSFLPSRDSPQPEPPFGARQGQLEERDYKATPRKESGISGGVAVNSFNPIVNQTQETASRIQASPSLSGSISTFPSPARPASMSSSASTIRPIPPSSPSPSLRSAALETNVHGSGVLSNRGPSQPRSARGSQLFGAASERRLNNLLSTIPTSPREESSLTEPNSRRIIEPAHPFHQATMSASTRLMNLAASASATSTVAQTIRSSPGRQSDQGGNTSAFQDNERSSTVSSASTPYSQSNSTSQIFEETSFFNQLSSNDSLSRGQQRSGNSHNDGISSRSGAFHTQSPFAQHQGVYGLGFMDQSPFYSRGDHRDIDDDDDDDGEDDGDNTDKDGDTESQDESGPLSEQIKQLHLEDVLAFLPSGGASASGVLPKPTNDGFQRKTASGDRMPFQLDDELASLGTRTLEEILQHDAGDEDDDYREREIKFKGAAGPSRVRGLARDGELMSKARSSPDRSGPNSRKSSAQNSVGSSFSDLSDSSVTQSAMEDAYLSGYNNSKIRPFTFYGNLQSPSIHNAYSLPQGQEQQTGGGSRKRKSSYEDISPLVMKTRTGIGLEQEIVYGTLCQENI